MLLHLSAVKAFVITAVHIYFLWKFFILQAEVWFHENVPHAIQQGPFLYWVTLESSKGFKAFCSINFYWMCLFKDVQPFLQIWEMNSSEYSTTQSGTVVFCISRLHKSVKDGRACATLHFFKFNLYLHKLCKHNPCTLMRVFGNFWVTCKVGNLIRDTPSVSFR